MNDSQDNNQNINSEKNQVPASQKGNGNENSGLQSALGSTLKGVAVMSIMSSYIFGPLFIFGGIGLWLTKAYENKIFVYIGVVIAFISTMILILKHSKSTIERFK